MTELTCAICGARPIDEFRPLPRRADSAPRRPDRSPIDGGGPGGLTGGPGGRVAAQKDQPVEERWWHVLGCRQVTRFERGPDDRLLPWSDEPPALSPALPEVAWLTPPASPADADAAPQWPSPLPTRRRDAPPTPWTPTASMPGSSTPGSSMPGSSIVGSSMLDHGQTAPTALAPPPPPPQGRPAAPAEPELDPTSVELVVALPDAPPMPFERPLWPADPGADADPGPLSAPPVAPPPTPMAAPGGSPEGPDELDRNDRFRTRSSAQPVERVVRRPVGLVGPNQPRAVDLTRRPAVQGRTVGPKGPGVEPRPATPVASSLFARRRSWRDGEGSGAGPVASRGLADPAGATDPGLAGPDQWSDAEPAPITSPTTSDIASDTGSGTAGDTAEESAGGTGSEPDNDTASVTRSETDSAAAPAQEVPSR